MTDSPSTEPDPDWDKLWSIFHDALEIEESERAAWVADACGDNGELEGRIEELLASHVATDHVLDRPPVFDELGPDGQFKAGQRVGVYRILEHLGEGGMGAVYLAEQLEPVQRRVALKVIKFGMDTREVVARFQRERQALAMMSHPNIAVALDAGATAEGRPYFAMELVEGVPFTTYCDSHRLSVRQRLELFRDVCKGVHHAHQKGIVHRDLKPSNALITHQEGVPIPKVIDFGVAKAMDPAGGEIGQLTSAGGRVGTPDYMSPEQRQGAEGDIDTRSDIYSLGVFLFEILTGVLPHRSRERASASTSARATEGDSPTTSALLSRLEVSEAEEAARLRSTSRDRLTRELKGDLDWIVAKAMAAGREFRYSSSAELAADIDRFLNLEPVLAGPPSAFYRFRKLVLRNRLAFAVAAVAGTLTLVLGIGLLVSSVRLHWALSIAEEENRRAEAVTDFLIESFEVSDPSSSHGRTVTAREVLDRGSARIDEGLASEPELRLRLMEVIATVYSKLGLSQSSIGHLERIVEERRRQSSADPLELGASLHALGAELARSGSFGPADQVLREALALRRQGGDGQMLDIAATLHQLGTLSLRSGNLAEADRLLTEALALRQTQANPNHGEVAQSLNNLGALRLAEGKLEAAADFQRRALELRRAEFGLVHPTVAASSNNLGRALDRMGETEAAASLYHQALDIWKETLGPDHPHLASPLSNLANLYFSQHEVELALEFSQRAVAIQEVALGEDHPTTLKVRHNRGEMLLRSGQIDLAEPVLWEILAAERRVLPDQHPQLASTLVMLGYLLELRGRYSDGEESVREALEIRISALPKGHRQIGEAQLILGRNLVRQERFEEGEELLLACRTIFVDFHGPDHERSRESAKQLAVLYGAWGRFEDQELWRGRASG
ncbi:MAG: serine/threonine-protein kinase [Deltaproteobacteria bacterium]|nr:serine/threonine-protein kinase [Deltaproteobacteria bacterium]